MCCCKQTLEEVNETNVTKKDRFLFKHRCLLYVLDVFSKLFSYYSNRYLSIIFDAMDQTKCNCPHVQGSAKWSYQEPRIQSQIGSFVVHGHGTYGVYWDEHVTGKDANFWATCLMGIIADLKATDYKDQPFPEVLYLQADNAKDNKNFVITGLCEMMRDTGVFKKVKLSYLPVGHTHEDVDASFGALSKMLRNYKGVVDGNMTSNAYTLGDFFRIWKLGWPSLRKLLYVKVSNEVQVK